MVYGRKSVPQEGTFFHVMRAFPPAWPRGGANGSREGICKVDEQIVMDALKRWADMQSPLKPSHQKNHTAWYLLIEKKSGYWGGGE